MGRFFILLLGVLLGAVGVFVLARQGLIALPQPPTTAIPVVVAPESVPREEDPALRSPPAELLPQAPTPAEIAAPVPVESVPPLPAPSSTVDPADVAFVEPPMLPLEIPPMPAGGLLIPVQGVKASQLTDTYTQSRGAGRLHDAIDIMAARGTPVFAVADGTVAKLFDSKPGGLTLYQFDTGEKLAYYYAHLDHYADGVVAGKPLKRGELIGYVGSTGNASPDAPHLHFAIFVLGPEKRWWKGTAINPYPLLGGRVAAGKQ